MFTSPPMRRVDSGTSSERVGIVFARTCLFTGRYIDPTVMEPRFGIVILPSSRVGCLGRLFVLISFASDVSRITFRYDHMQGNCHYWVHQETECGAHLGSWSRIISGLRDLSQ